MNQLSAAELADLAGVTEGEVGRLVDLGVLVARAGRRAVPGDRRAEGPTGHRV
jgi:hypothetical protein